MNDIATRKFRRIGLITVAAVYFLILVGAIVRASGAGMGCPDWPTCFGQWIPPTQESQLPTNYHEIYAELGYANTDFNPVKTWTEYLNRLTGVTIGILIILTVWRAIPFLKFDRPVFYASLTAFLAVLFQGWLGAVVVSSNLHPLLITSHMLLALAIVALLLYAVIRSQKTSFLKFLPNALDRNLTWWLAIVLAMTLIQIILGAQVRESVDLIAKSHDFAHREIWLNELPWVFNVHKAFALLLLCCNLVLLWRMIRILPQQHLLFRLSLALGFLILLAITTGISMVRLGIPPIIQPFHLLIANLIFGVQFTLLIALRYSLSVTPIPSSGSSTEVLSTLSD